MQHLKTLVVVAGTLLAYHGYVNGKKPKPSPVPDPGPAPSVTVISEADTDFPSAPTGTLAVASLPVRSVLLSKGTPDDAIRLARAYRSFAELLSRRPSIKSTADFRDIYIASTQALLKKTSVDGRYAGSLDTAINNTIVASFAEFKLVENGEILSTTWTDACANAAEQAFKAVSYQCFQAFLELSAKPKPTPALFNSDTTLAGHVEDFPHGCN